MHCKKCGAQLNSVARFCKKCGTQISDANAQTAPIVEAQPPSHQFPPPDQPAPVYDQTLPVSQPRAINNRTLWIGIAAVVVLGAAGFYWYSRGGVERKLEDAMAKGNLLKPPGESAYDYYRKLKEHGMSGSLLRIEARLTPLVTARPQQMIADLAVPGNKAEITLSDWQEAQTLMNWAAEMQSNDKAIAARASYCAGRVANLSNRKDEAITYWKRAAEQDATWAMPLNGMGLIYNERKNYQMARSFLFEAVRREPQFALPYNNIGTSYFYEKNDVQAEGYYRQAIERAPQWARPHAWLADIALRRKDYAQAAQEYETVLNLDPSGVTGIDVNKIRQQLELARRSTGASAVGEDSTGYVDIRGFIGNLKILFSFKERNGQVTGSYRYEGRNESMRLEGSVGGDGAFTLTEFAPDGRRTGTITFKGTPTDNAEVIYAGTWASADGQRKLPFRLQPVGD